MVDNMVTIVKMFVSSDSLIFQKILRFLKKSTGAHEEAVNMKCVSYTVVNFRWYIIIILYVLINVTTLEEAVFFSCLPVYHECEGGSSLLYTRVTYT